MPAPRVPREKRGHPSATPVNRDERTTAVAPAFFPSKACIPQPQSSPPHLVLEQWLRCCAPVTHQDQGLRALRRVCPWLRWQPQKTLCSPPRPIHAADRVGRTGLWLRIGAIQPLVAHGTGATSSCAWAGSAAACNQVSWLCQPRERHCRRRPIEQTALLIRRPSTRRRACRLS